MSDSWRWPGKVPQGQVCVCVCVCVVDGRDGDINVNALLAKCATEVASD
jgi:hypothetical protein